MSLPSPLLPSPQLVAGSWMRGVEVWVYADIFSVIWMYMRMDVSVCGLQAGENTYGIRGFGGHAGCVLDFTVSCCLYCSCVVAVLLPSLICTALVLLLLAHSANLPLSAFCSAALFAAAAMLAALFDVLCTRHCTPTQHTHWVPQVVLHFVPQSTMSCSAVQYSALRSLLCSALHCTGPQ